VPLDTGIRRLLLFQIGLVAVTSAVFLVIFEPFSALSVWYGGFVAVTNSLLQARCASSDRRRPERSPGQSVAAVYLCMVQRFLLVALLFGLGLGALKLDALAVLAGFIVGQIVMIIMATRELAKK
jgi:ATP synthase protein I